MIDGVLKSIGLSQREIKIYLALLMLKQSKTKGLCKETGISDSHIYPILHKLIQKGLISYRVQNNGRIYVANPPESLHNVFESEQEQLKSKILELDKKKSDVVKAIALLKNKPVEAESLSNYKYFEGISGVKSMWLEFNRSMDEKKIIKIYTAKREGWERLLGFYTEHHALRQKNKVRERLLYPLGEGDLARKRLATFEFTEIRQADLKNTAEWAVAGDYFLIMYSTTKTPRGFLIKDEQFAQTFSQVFDQIWFVAEKITS